MDINKKYIDKECIDEAIDMLEQLKLNCSNTNLALCNGTDISIIISTNHTLLINIMKFISDEVKTPPNVSLIPRGKCPSILDKEDTN